MMLSELTTNIDPDGRNTHVVNCARRAFMCVARGAEIAGLSGADSGPCTPEELRQNAFCDEVDNVLDEEAVRQVGKVMAEMREIVDYFNDPRFR